MHLICLGCHHRLPGRLGGPPETCPACGQEMYSWREGSPRARYRDPVTGSLVTLGRTGYQLPLPCRLDFQRAHSATGTPITRPAGDRAREVLDRARELILAPGCVVSITLVLADERARPEAPGLQLVAVAGADPDTLTTNQPLESRPCAACGAQVLDLDKALMPARWTARPHQFLTGPAHNKRWRPNEIGPHPADTYTCENCDPRRAS